MEWLNIIIFAIGLVLIIKGAGWVTDYGSRLAKAMGVSELIIGVTLVATATSLPELAISLISAISAVGQIATGTIIGSNISNIALILGLSALACPLATDHRFLKQGFITLGFSILVSLLLVGSMLWYEGLVILICFIVYITYVLKIGKQDTLASSKTNEMTEQHKWKCLLFCIAGGLTVVAGAHLLVHSTVQIARWLEIPEILIAVIVIAIGTSLPELATSVTAAMKHMRGISLGNIIGSNIFNIAILGITSLFNAAPANSHVVLLDLPVMLAVTILLLVFMRTGWKLSRKEGLILLVVYCLFVTLQFLLRT